MTGAEGFVGGHLVPALRAHGHAVVTTGRSGRADETLDLPDEARARSILLAHRPEALIHLAALSEVPAAEANPSGALRSNVEGTSCLLEALRSTALSCRFIHISTSNVYGSVPADRQPIREAERLAPRSVYAASKVAAEACVQGYTAHLARPPVILRPFNHVGPGQSTRFALPGFAAQIAAIELGLAPPVVQVGNLRVRRDVLDVRDVVQAYCAVVIAEQLPPVMNVCRGSADLLEDLLEQLCTLARCRIEVRVATERLRGNDLDLLVGSPVQLQRATGWEPRIALGTTLRDVLDDWRARSARGRVASRAEPLEGRPR